MNLPMAFRWDGDAMVPLPHYARQANEAFVVGEIYRLDASEEATARSRAHYFASIKDLWASLPEAIAPDFPSPTHLRKHALIRTGWFDKRTVPLATHEEALRVASFIRRPGEYSIVLLEGDDRNIVAEYTAKSQKPRNMKREEFQRSKDDVLAFIRQLVGLEEPA